MKPMTSRREIVRVVLSDCYRMATQADLEQYIGDVLRLLRCAESNQAELETLVDRGSRLLELSWRWKSDFAPKHYNVQISLLKATIFALRGKLVSMGEEWEIAHYVAAGPPGKRVAARMAGDAIKRVTAGYDVSIPGPTALPRPLRRAGPAAPARALRRAGLSVREVSEAYRDPALGEIGMGARR